MPRACSISAVVRPPMPPPTMMTFMAAYCVRPVPPRNLNGFVWLTRLPCGFEAIETAKPINGDRNQPAGDENSDDEVAEAAEIVVQRAYKGPERPDQAQPVGEQAERLDAADEDGDQDG